MLKSDATRNRDPLEHLAQVRALSQAITSAILAIEKNDLRQLETHLAVQETICSRLSAIRGSFITGESDADDDVDENQDAVLRREIIEAHVALAQLNRVYAALLKRSSKSVGMLIALHRSNGVGYHGELSALPQRRSWSCEV
jgi:hypothetical protein